MTAPGIHRWRAQTLAGDLVRGGIAVVFALLLLLAVPARSIGFWAILALLALFGLYLAGTISRLQSIVTLDDTGVRVGGGLFGARSIKWAELQNFELRHFPTSRDRKTGWMDLKLTGGGQTITIDDRIDGFASVLARAWDAARNADVGISDATHANLIAAGILSRARL